MTSTFGRNDLKIHNESSIGIKLFYSIGAFFLFHDVPIVTSKMRARIGRLETVISGRFHKKSALPNAGETSWRHRPAPTLTTNVTRFLSKSWAHEVLSAWHVLNTFRLIYGLPFFTASRLLSILKLLWFHIKQSSIYFTFIILKCEMYLHRFSIRFFVSFSLFLSVLNTDKCSVKLADDWYWTWVLLGHCQCDQIGRFIGLWATF